MTAEVNKPGLLIISDTPMYRDGEGYLVFEPTLTEIEEVSDLFAEMRWVSYLREGPGGGNTRSVGIGNLTLEPVWGMRGGHSVLQKLKVLAGLPLQAWLFFRKIPDADVVHTRGPSVPALLVILYSFFDTKTIFWHKYAGNWSEKNSPLAYRVQRWLLRKLDRKNVRITISGSWPGLHKGFLKMENPCLKEDYLRQFKISADPRSFRGKLSVCFVGNLDPFKGALRLVTALTSNEIASSIEGIWIVGDGQEKESLQRISGTSPFPIHLCGFLRRNEIFETIYKNCHIMVLPSETEGFPKVVAEAAAHGCIPVVTAVSALDQYIEDGVNGFLLNDSSVQSIKATFVERVVPHSDLAVVSKGAFAMAHLFTYERFRQRVQAPRRQRVPASRSLPTARRTRAHRCARSA